MKRFNPNTVKPSCYLAPLTFKQKQQGVREYKRALRLADEAADPSMVKKVRDFNAPHKIGQGSNARLRRAMLRKEVRRLAWHAEFRASLGV